MQPTPPRRPATRVRRDRTDIRDALLDAALVEFGAKGFDGASTRAIAARIDAHQPQINYHFDSKAALWTAAVNHLFGLLAAAMDGIIPVEPTKIGIPQLAAAFAKGIERFVAFVAKHPELNQIMVHEGTADSERLQWITQTHVKPVFDALSLVWRKLQRAGVAAAIDADIAYYMLVGGASIPYINAPEVRLLAGRDPSSPEWVAAHAKALKTILLPGLASATT